VLRKGSVAAEGQIQDLTAVTSHYKLVAAGVDDALLGELRETGASVERVNGHFDLTARDVAHLNALVDRLRARGASLEELTPLRSSLEDVFVGLVAPPREETDGETGRRGDGGISQSAFTPSPSHPVPPSETPDQKVHDR
jgi:hypothetical protein